MKFDHKKFFDSVRKSLFGGSMTQSQVDGMDIILMLWEEDTANTDVRHLAYELATAYHETAQKMQPIAEYGKGSGQPYGVKDPVTHQTYYGRGLVQLTWRENYARADKEMGWTGADSCEWHADLQLTIEHAAPTMFKGMEEGWFRTKDSKPETLERYFSETVDDPYNARGIINGDKTKVPDWGGGASMGNIIKGYHNKFKTALVESTYEEDTGQKPTKQTVTITVTAPDDVEVVVLKG